MSGAKSYISKKVTRSNYKADHALYVNRRKVASTLDYRISIARPIELLIGLIDSLDLFYLE